MPTIGTTSNAGQSGIGLVETVVALAVLGTVAVALLSGVVGINRAASTVDERATAEGLAQFQMEWAQDAASTPYVPDASAYSAAPVPGTTGNATYPDYANYSASIAVEPQANPDDGIQKITVTITRSGVTVFILEGFKRDR